jgi:ketosteroid isomerase-like protein
MHTRLLVLVIALLTRSATAQGSLRSTAADQALADSIRTMFSDYQARMNSGDYAGGFQYYADDSRAYWVEEGEVKPMTRAARDRAVEQLRGMGGSHYSYSDTQVTILDRDVALLATKFVVTLGTGASAVTFSGFVTITLIRTPAGWRFLIGHTSSAAHRSG